MRPKFSLTVFCVLYLPLMGAAVASIPTSEYNASFEVIASLAFVALLFSIGPPPGRR